MFDWVVTLYNCLMDFFNKVLTFGGDLFNYVWDFVYNSGMLFFDYAKVFVVALANWTIETVFQLVASVAGSNELQFSIINSEIVVYQQINSFFPLYQLLSYGISALLVYMAFLSVMFIVKIVLYALP